MLDSVRFPYYVVRVAKPRNSKVCLLCDFVVRVLDRILRTRLRKRTRSGAWSTQQYPRNLVMEIKQYERKMPVSKPQFIIKYTPAEPTYYLKFGLVRHPQDGKLKYPFDTLVKDIKNMKLPSPTWKIKVVVRSNKISSIIFTNKCVLERTVTFNAKSEYFEVVVENKPAILLGCPGVVSCIEDIEILLNIIHSISAKNPMIYYKK